MASNISDNDIVTLNELRGVCERSVFQPNQRNRIVIARSQEPGIRNQQSNDYVNNSIGSQGGDTERPKLGSLDKSAVDQMNTTYHFNKNSNMSIQAGKLTRDAQNTSPPVPANNLGLSFGPFKNQTLNTPNRIKGSKQDSQFSIGTTRILASHSLTVDIDSVNEVPDAMDRIRQRATEKKQAQIQKKRQMAEQVETARAEVLDNYNIKTIL